MDHDFAVSSRAAERYLLQEISSGERDEFEAHFFECAICAEEVKSAHLFIENARAALAASPPRKPELGPVSAPWWNFSWWKPSFGLAALVAVTVLAAYPWLVVIPDLRSQAGPRAITAHTLLAESRGEPRKVPLSPGAPLLLVLDVNAPGNFPRYFASIQTAAGRKVLEAEVAAPSRSEPFHFLVPNPQWEPGSYVLILSGATANSSPATELARYHFQIEVP